MKKELFLIFVLVVSLGFTVFTTVQWISAEMNAFKYEQYYEAMRGELEANYRTQGKGIDAAFVCKARPINDK